MRTITRARGLVLGRTRAVVRTARALVAALLGLAAGLAVLVAAAEPAHACSCAVLDDAAARSGADLVFTGRLLERHVRSPGPFGVQSSADPAILTFQVDRVFKGSAAAVQRLSTSAFGSSCGWELDGEGPFLVFAQGAGASASTGLCAGNRPGTAPAGWGVGEQPLPGDTGPDLPALFPWGRVLLGVVVAGAAAAVVILLRRRRRV